MVKRWNRSRRRLLAGLNKIKREKNLKKKNREKIGINSINRNRMANNGHQLALNINGNEMLTYGNRKAGTYTCPYTSIFDSLDNNTAITNPLNSRMYPKSCLRMNCSCRGIICNRRALWQITASISCLEYARRELCWSSRSNQIQYSFFCKPNTYTEWICSLNTLFCPHTR